RLAMPYRRRFAHVLYSAIIWKCDFMGMRPLLLLAGLKLRGYQHYREIDTRAPVHGRHGALGDIRIFRMSRCMERACRVLPSSAAAGSSFTSGGGAEASRARGTSRVAALEQQGAETERDRDECHETADPR